MFHARPRYPATLCALAIGAAVLLTTLAGPVFAQSYYGTGSTHSFSACGETESCLGPRLTAGEGMAPHDMSVGVLGDMSAREVTSQYATGYFYHHPICVYVRERMTIQIEVTSANVDNVLMLVGPSGVFSDDDGGHGTNAKITANVAAGHYYLYAGTYNYGATGQLGMTISDPYPQPVASCTCGTGHCSAHSSGHATSGNSSHRGHDRGDSDDHSRGRRGHHRRGHGARPDDSTTPTHVTYAPTPLSSPGMCPAGAETIELGRRRNASWSSEVASGRVNASDRVGNYSSGWLPETAQTCVIVHDAGYYSFEVTSSSIDTVMALIPAGHGSSASFYDDDSGSGLLSKVSGRLAAGTYLLYVGTYSPGERADYRLYASRH